MDSTELGAMHKTQLVDLLYLTQHVMQGFTRTILLVSKTITGDGVDGAELTRKAAQMIARRPRSAKPARSARRKFASALSNSSTCWSAKRFALSRHGK